MASPLFVHSGREASALAGAAASTYYFTATAGSPAHTKGSWAEIENSTPFDTDWFEFRIIGAEWAGTHDWYLFDVAIGATEQTILPNLLLRGSLTAADAKCNTGVFAVPFRIPAGTKVSFRCQCSTASKDLYAVAHFYQSGVAYPWEPCSRAEGWGADAANSRGTQVPVVSADTKGAWQQLVASTAFDVRYLLLCLSALNTITYPWLFDVGIGSGGNEYVVIPNIFKSQWAPSGNAYESGPIFLCLPFSAPAGTRVAVRGQCGTTGSVADVVAVGLG